MNAYLFVELKGIFANLFSESLATYLLYLVYKIS